MKEEQIIKLIKKHKYIFIGEIHGTKEIPKKTLELLKKITKNYKVIFCLELPIQAEKSIYSYIKGKINKKTLFSLNYLNDAVYDNRINNNLLKIYKELHKLGVSLKYLENYDNENTDKRDKEMALNFMDIVKKYKAEKYIVYVGNMHVIDKTIKIKKFVVNPIKIYLPKNILSQTLTIQFKKSNTKNIIFNKKNNTVYYNLFLT